MHELCELCLVAFHQHCLLPPSSYFCFLLIFSLKKEKKKAFISFSFDEALFLAVVFIFLTFIPIRLSNV